MRVASRFAARKAIESLRAGVPNLAAVEALGLDLPQLDDAFERNRKADADHEAYKHRGFFVEGNFGSGKSHALRFLQSKASKAAMASSLVPISKETQLGDLTAVYRAAIGSLTLRKGVLSGSLAGVFEDLDVKGPNFKALCNTLADPKENLDPLFLASALLLRRCRADYEFVEQIYDFWDGAPPAIAAWKPILRDIDGCPSIKAPKVADLAPQRFRFAALSLAAAGYSGWLLALDEMELIAKFSIKSRATAYANISYLFSRTDDFPSNRLWFPVGAITGDFMHEVITKREDDRVIPERFRHDLKLVSSAIAGIDILKTATLRIELREPTVLTLEQSFETIRALYQTAYDCECGSITAPATGRLSKSMRSYVREWIAAWDIHQLNPEYNPSVESREMLYDLGEDGNLEYA